MRTNLALADLGDLLDQPILAVLATHRRDGTVMLSPVWFEWDLAAMVVWAAGPTDGKVRHLTADPRATIVVAEQTIPYRGLEITGRAELTTDGFADIAKRISTRYVGAAAAEAMIDGFRDGLLIRVLPDRLRAWDFVDDYGAWTGPAGSPTGSPA